MGLYVQTTDVQRELSIDDDDERFGVLDDAIDSAEQYVAEYCDRRFESVTGQTREFLVTDWTDTLEVDDYQTITTLEIRKSKDANWEEITDFVQHPIGSQTRGGLIYPYTMVFYSDCFPPIRGYSSVRIRADWGWTAIPKTIKRATVILAGIEAARFVGGVPDAKYADAEIILDRFRRVSF